MRTARSIAGFIGVAVVAFVLGLAIGLNTNLPEGGQAIVPAVSSMAAADKAAVVSPSKGTFHGEGENIELEVKAWRVFSPFGMSPAEMVSHVKALEEKGGQSPGITIGEDGVVSTGAARASHKAEGLSWTLWDAIKSFFRRIMWWGFGLAAALFVLWLIPVTKPIASAICRGLAALVPILGSLVERIVARFKWQKPLEQTVKGVELVKAGKTEAERQTINQQLMATQDASTQATVKAIKANGA